MGDCHSACTYLASGVRKGGREGEDGGEGGGLTKYSHVCI